MNPNKIYKRGVFALLCIAAVSAFFDWKKLPLSIMAGGLLGLANLKGLIWGLRDFASHQLTGRVVFWSTIRFFIIGLVLVILALLKLIDFIGILIGFTVIFILIVKAGIETAGKYAKEGAGGELQQPADSPDLKKQHD